MHIGINFVTKEALIASLLRAGILLSDGSTVGLVLKAVFGHRLLHATKLERPHVLKDLLEHAVVLLLVAVHRYVDHVLHTDAALVAVGDLRSEELLDQDVVGDSHLLTVLAQEATLAHQCLYRRLAGVAVRDVALDDDETLHRLCIGLAEDGIVDVTETHDLQNFLGLRCDGTFGITLDAYSEDQHVGVHDVFALSGLPPDRVLVSVLGLENVGPSDGMFVAFVVHKTASGLHSVRGKDLGQGDFDATSGLDLLFFLLLLALLELNLCSSVNTPELVGIVAFSFLQKGLIVSGELGSHFNHLIN